MVAVVVASALLLVAPAPVEPEWLALRLDHKDAFPEVFHDRASGLLIHQIGRPNCAVDQRYEARIRRTTEEEDGTQRWRVVELDDPAADIRALVQDVTPDKPPRQGSQMEALVLAFTPPESCSREIEYLISTPEGYCSVLSAVPCSDEQRERLKVFAHAYIAGEQPTALDPQTLRPSRAIVPADLDILVPGVSANRVLEEFGSPLHAWPRFPDAFSWEYFPSDALPEVYMVLLDFAKDRRLEKVRLLKTGW